MKVSVFVPYLLIMAGVTYLIRALPFVLIRKKIKNRFLNAFLEYIPYTVLTAMTIPAMFYATDNPISAMTGFAAAAVTAYLGKSLITVALAACGGVALCEGVLMII
ncbi:MAG: AzlD domain-containing protein [Clostridiales bacterium]|nr:AzlD domain-containing protein [Clostridiales bacterium]